MFGLRLYKDVIGSDSYVLFWDFGVILEKNRKSVKLENLGIIRLLRRGEVEVPKWHPLGTPHRSYCSQRVMFLLLFRKSTFRTPIVEEP